MFDKNSWQLEDISFILNEYSELVRWGFKDETVLHFGCGSGFITGKFLLPHLPRNVQVVGVDEDSELVNFAKKYHGHDNVEYRQLSEIQDCVFDHILSFYYFNETLDELKLFTMLNQLLSHNGDLLMILLNNHSILDIFQQMETKEKYSSKLGKLQIKSLDISTDSDVLTKSMVDANFTNIICKCFDRYHIFPNKIALKNFLKSNLCDIKLNEEQFNGFVDDFMASIQQEHVNVKHIGRNGKLMGVPYKLTFLYGKKSHQNVN